MKNRIEKYIFITFMVLLFIFPISGCKKSSTTDINDNAEFLSALEQAGFSVNEVTIQPVNLFKLCEMGIIPDCYGNNANAPYMAVFVDEEDMPEYGTFNLDMNDALLVMGTTPPEVHYFSYRSYLSQAIDEKGYERKRNFQSETITPVGVNSPGASENPFMRLFSSLGDTINNLSINTEGENAPYNSKMMIISTANQSIDTLVRKTAVAGGYNEGIINTDVIPSQVLNMGHEASSDRYIFLHRVNDAMDQEALDAYLAEPPIKVYYLTMQNEIEENPFDVPDMRVRGNGKTEFALYPEMKELRSAILSKYGEAGYQEYELVTKPWLPESYDALQQQYNALGEIRDTAYLATETFKLPDDPDVFAIAYGVIHSETGKSAYSNISVYGTEKANGVAGLMDDKTKGSATEFLSGSENAGYFYVVKIARDCGNESYCIEVPADDEQPCYTAPLDKDVFVVFRAYLEPETMTGPNPVEMIYDQVILFEK
jgi:hypothetical protein